ncbi:hypothetical protein TNCT_193921 [Trichonephila clavata]|uniref:Uncharacterized protein n=1 Tax=Trichonephila clavata TaxID=2740835 RepID=A0A8X6HUJ5_TRICU|nr:hypothetical protein TNCT_193921 [Trichonephila clavata]
MELAETGDKGNCLGKYYGEGQDPTEAVELTMIMERLHSSTTNRAATTPIKAILPLGQNQKARLDHSGVESDNRFSSGCNSKGLDYLGWV